MSYSTDELEEFFDRTDGRCHICGGPLAFCNYARFGARGAWEVEHSNPKANGGTNRRNNLYAAHITCNRRKRAGSTRAARVEWGLSAAPYSKAKRARVRDKNTAIGVAVAGIGAKMLGASERDALIYAVIGGVIGRKLEPDPQRR